MSEQDLNLIREQVALFRYGLIGDLVHRDPNAPGLYALLRKKAEQSYSIPGSRHQRVAAETIRDWLKAYRKGGFEALLPRPRCDLGSARVLPQDIIDVLVSIKEDHPEYTVPLVIAEARKSGKIPSDLKLPRSSIYRLLGRRGLMHRAPKAEGSTKDRLHFAFRFAGELWMSDVMHGPAVWVQDGERRRKRKTYLIAFLDDATRVVPYAAFALAENTAAYLPVLEQAILRRGIPKRLYVDNGAAFRSHHLALVCAKLGTALLHAKPYDAAAKGKQERWFRTVRMQLLPVLGEHDLASLANLNSRLWAWVEGEYHRAPHRGLDGQTPLDRWASCAADVRFVEPQRDLGDLFLFETRRKVHKDRTVSLEGRLYEVEPELVGCTVLLRYHPNRRGGGAVQVWLDGKRHKDAAKVDAYANCFVRRGEHRGTILTSEAPPAPAAGLPLRNLRSDKEGC